ncbi:MAG: hypothetical protein ACO34C_08920, partial [Candidatus Kapaibacteriota bacterium]
MHDTENEAEEEISHDLISNVTNRSLRCYCIKHVKQHPWFKSMKKLLYFFLISLGGSLTTFSQPMRFESRGMGGGAEFHSLSISPFSPFTMRVSGSSSQLFTSIDLGATWNAIQHGNIAGGGFSGKVTFTSSPLIQYAISDQKGLHIPV